MWRGQKVFVAAVGDANSPTTWSGIPYHFFKAGEAAHLFDTALALSTDGWQWKARRAAWNLRQVARHWDRHGGYQFSVPFLERLWRPVQSVIDGSRIINCFQLYAPSVVDNHRVEKWFFIDQTLRQLFDYYGHRQMIGRSIALDAVQRERDGYAAAAGVMAHSHWAAESVVRDYGVPKEKVHVVVPGASIDQDLYDQWEQETMRTRDESSRARAGSLRLVFVGKYWHRKGLDRLLRAVGILRNRGVNVTLRAIGCERHNLPTELRDTPGVEWIGFIDRRTTGVEFLRLVSECDVGCHLSRVEAGGIAQREFHALGLPILGTDVGGAGDHRFSDASISLPADATDDLIVEKIADVASSPEKIEALRHAAWSQRHDASYSHTVQQVRSIWQRMSSI